MLIKRSMSAKLLTTPACGHLANTELASVPPKRRGALPNGGFTFMMEVVDAIQIHTSPPTPLQRGALIIRVILICSPVFILLMCKF